MEKEKADEKGLASRVEELENLIAKHSGSLSGTDSAARITSDRATKEIRRNQMNIGEQGTEQFTIRTRLNGEVIGEQKIHDPFIRNVIKLRGLKHAWRALFGITVQVSIDGTPGVTRAIMTLDPGELQRETEKMREGRDFPTKLYTDTAPSGVNESANPTETV